MSTDGGLFGPDSVTWRVHADPTYAVAGLRGLLLQALHPLAMAAVEQNGGFEADPWGRLTRTSPYIATHHLWYRGRGAAGSGQGAWHPPEAPWDGSAHRRGVSRRSARPPALGPLLR